MTTDSEKPESNAPPLSEQNTPETFKSWFLSLEEDNKAFYLIPFFLSLLIFSVFIYSILSLFFGFITENNLVGGCK